MQLTFIPLLPTQRDLYTLPRGRARFLEYLSTLTGGTDDLVLPLSSMNPMGKEHIPALLDRLLAAGAEEVAAHATAAAEARLRAAPGLLRVALVLADDLKGGWTNRTFTEMSSRFGIGPLLSRGWVAVHLWTSEEPAEEDIRREVGAAVYRAAHVLTFGPAKTLAERLRQEGRAMAFAGATAPTLEPDDLAYTREVLRPHLDSDHLPILTAALYGDEIAHSLGYTPLGLSPKAGYALALAEGRGDRDPFRTP